MKHLITFLLILITSSLFNGCTCSRIDAGEEGVLTYQPWFFGHGGIDDDPIKTGMTYTAASTVVDRYDVKPVEYKEVFDDLITADNNPVDFKAYIETQIIKGEAPYLHENFGKKWYDQKVQEKFRMFIRNFGRSKTMFELTTNASVTDEMAKTAMEQIIKHIKKEKLPVQINRVNVGKVSPPSAVIEETIKTAEQNQRIKTEASRARAELAREDAERNKATADKAYRIEFGMTTREYLRLRELEIEKEKLDIVKNKDNVTVILNSGGAIPMLNVRK